MRVSVVTVKHLSLSNLLQSSTRFEHDFNWHLVEDLLFIR